MAISNLGNGTGYIYITDSSGNIISNLTNSEDNKKAILADALVNSALPNETGTLYSSTYRKYYLYASGSAVEGTISGATEITNYVVNVGFNNRLPYEAVTIGTDTILSYTRSSSIQRLVVDTGAAAADLNFVYYIREANSLISDGDILIIVGIDNTKLTTLIDVTPVGDAAATVTLSGVGQLALDNNTDYVTYDNNTALMLMYSTTTTMWHEINRTPAAVITIKKLRDAGINIPVAGSKIISTISGGDSITIDAGVTEGAILVTGTHSVGSGTYDINKPTGGTPKEGDKFTILWNADLTTSGAVNVFGKTLTSGQHSGGSSNSMEITSTYINSAWQDGVVSRSDDASEDSLGNPSSNDYILSSTTAGVRSWVAAPSGVKTVSATFDTAINDDGGVSNKTIATHTILTDAFPQGAMIMCDEAIIEMETALTSGGAADVSVGLNGGGITDVDSVDDERDFNSAPYSSATSVTRSSPGGSVTILKASSGTCNMTVTVTVAVLTAGKFIITVPYMTS